MKIEIGSMALLVTLVWAGSCGDSGKSADGGLQPICRHRLFEKNIYQRGETDSYEMPRELAVGDVDANGKADLVFVLQDRIAIYLQDAER